MTTSLPFEPLAIVEGIVSDLADHGDGVLSWEDRPLMVAGVLPGERVEVAVRKRYRNISVGECLRILEPSPDRVDPPCPLFGRCSGCQLQHAGSDLQHRVKRRRVQRALAAAGLDERVVRPTWGSPTALRYRNHARFTVVDGAIGFMRRRPKVHLPVDDCLLMDERITEAVACARGRVDDATQFNVRVGIRTGERMIQPSFGDRLPVPSGQPHVHEVVFGHRFRVSAPAFFQVNTRAADLLCQLVRHVVTCGPARRVVDAYAGVGTFAAALADVAERIVAVEYSGPAMDDATCNLAHLGNVELRCGAAEDLLPDLEGPVDALVLDPPRRGCHRRALEAVVAARPACVAYVSCDPASLARDLRLLTRTYVLDWVQPVDMFPQTHHVEAVAALRREDASPIPPPRAPAPTYEAP